MNKAALLLLLPLLTACQDQTARTENAELLRRVAALEAEVQSLKAQVQSPIPADAAAVTTRAAAQNCAMQLSRFLEGYRRSSSGDAYPEKAAEVEKPPACKNQRLKWRGLRAEAYDFAILNAAGQVLAEARGEK